MNKKIVFALTAVALTAGSIALAQGYGRPMGSCTIQHNLEDIDPACSETAVVGAANTNAWGICCILDAVYTVTDWIFVALMILVGLLVIWGGLDIATAGGNEEKVNSGRDRIKYAMVGLAVALLSRAIPAVVKQLIM